MDRIGSDEALRAQPWHLRIDTEGHAPAGLAAALRARHDVTAVARVYELPVVMPDGRVSLTARVVQPVEGGVGAFPFAVRRGEPALTAGEATLGREAFTALHVKDGDRVRLTAAGHPFTLRITGRHVEPDDDGMVAVVPAAGFPRAALREVDDPAWALRLAPGADEPAIRAAALATGPGRLTVSKPIESLRGEAAQTRPVLYGLTALRLLIGAVNLLTTLLLGVRERSRDVAVLSAVGASHGRSPAA